MTNTTTPQTKAPLEVVRLSETAEKGIRKLINGVLDVEHVGLVQGRHVLRTTAPVTYDALRAIFLAGVDTSSRYAMVTWPVLKGVAKFGGDGFKDPTVKGQVVYVWNQEKPLPYKPGQFPRVGNGAGWTAERDQFEFTAASLGEIVDALETPLLEAKEKLRQITGAIKGYYLALNERKHADVAQSAAFAFIEEVMGMRWESGASSLQVPAARRALEAIDGMQSPFASYLDPQAKITEASMAWKEGMPIPTVRISVEDGKLSFTHLNGDPLGLTADELKACEEAGKSATPLEPWQHHAKKLTQWRHCMSYNDSYFGEPAGLLKQVVAELERLMPPHPVKADTCVELERGLDERLADFIKTASVTSKVDEFFGGEPHIELMLVYGAAGPDVFSAIKLFRSKDSRRTLVEWCRTISRNELWRFASVSLTICNRAVYGLNVMTQILSPLGVVGFDPGFPCFKESSKDRFVNQRAQSALGMYEAFSDGRIAFLSEDLRDGFFDEAIKGELNLCFDHLGRYKVNNKTDAAPILTGLSMAYSEFIPFDGGQA